jgi:hypothetical protein
MALSIREKGLGFNGGIDKSSDISGWRIEDVEIPPGY